MCVCACASCGVVWCGVAVAVAWGPPPHSMLSCRYHALAPLVFPEADTVPTWVSSVKWDGVKQCTESSDYVKRISDALKALSKRITALVRICRVSCCAMGGRDSQSELRVTSADGFWCSSGCRPTPRVCLLRGALVRTLRGGRIPSAQVQYAWAWANGDGHHLHQPERVQNPAATVRCVRPCTAALRSATH